MRHSRIDLTMNVYTDPKLLDVVGAVNTLPTLTAFEPAPAVAMATGTHDVKNDLVQPTVMKKAPDVAPAVVSKRQTLSKDGMLGNLSGPFSKCLQHEKTPENAGFFGVLSSDADGARTRNLRIDSLPDTLLSVNIALRDLPNEMKIDNCEELAKAPDVAPAVVLNCQSLANHDLVDNDKGIATDRAELLRLAATLSPSMVGPALAALQAMDKATRFLADARVNGESRNGGNL